MQKKEKRSKKIKRKLLHKYRFVVLIEDTFEERFSFKLNRLNVFYMVGLVHEKDFRDRGSGFVVG